MRATVIINPIAGRGRSAEIAGCDDLARRVLAEQGFEPHVIVTLARGDAFEHAARARAGGDAVVVAWGGDGTVNEVASALVHSGTPLGIVPAGSGNGLARDLGLPADPARALAVIGAGRRRTIDAGTINGSYFFNVAGVGLDARIAARLAAPGARRGLSGYIRATLDEWPSYEARRYVIRGDGWTVDRRALFVAFANSRQYGRGAQIAPAARLDDGRVDVVVVDARPMWRIALQVPAFFRGTLRDGRAGLTMRQASKVSVESDAEMLFHVDGEIREAGRTLELATHAGAIDVMAL